MWAVAYWRNTIAPGLKDSVHGSGRVLKRSRFMGGILMVLGAVGCTDAGYFRHESYQQNAI